MIGSADYSVEPIKGGIMLFWAHDSFVVRISTAEQGVIINKIYPSTGGGSIHSKNTF